MVETGAAVEPWTNAVQLARDVGALGADQAYFLLDLLTESAVGLVTEMEDTLVGLYAQIDAVKREHGLSDAEDFVLDDDAPPEWLELNRQWDRHFRELREQLFRHVGEPGMARDIVRRPDEFAGSSSEGWGALLALSEEEGDSTA